MKQELWWWVVHEISTGERHEGLNSGISLLPGGSPSQQLEAWLRVPGEDDVFCRSEDPVADDHLDFEGKPGSDQEESPGVKVGYSLVDDHRVVRVEDHQGKEVANEVFSQSRLASESKSHSHWIMLVFIDKVGAERSIYFPSFKNFFRFISRLGGLPAHRPALLSGSPLIEGGPRFGVNLPS